MVKDNPKVMDSVTEDNVKKIFSHRAPANNHQSLVPTQPKKLSFSRVQNKTVYRKLDTPAMGGDVVPSLGGRKKNLVDQISE